MPEQNNGKKRSRRYIICGIVIALATASFIYTTLMGVKHGCIPSMLEFYNIYTLILFGVAAVAVGSFTFTDIFGKFGK